MVYIPIYPPVATPLLSLDLLMFWHPPGMATAIVSKYIGYNLTNLLNFVTVHAVATDGIVCIGVFLSLLPR